MKVAFNESCREMMVIGEQDRIWRRGEVDDFDGILVAAGARRVAIGRAPRTDQGVDTRGAGCGRIKSGGCLT